MKNQNINQEETDLEGVLQDLAEEKTDQKEEAHQDLEEETPEDQTLKCSERPATSAEKDAKSHSDQQKENQSIALLATKKVVVQTQEDQIQEETITKTNLTK